MAVVVTSKEYLCVSIKFNLLACRWCMANENHGRQCKYFQKQNGMVCYGLCTVVFPNNISSITSFCSRAMESSSESGQVADDSIEVVVSLPSGHCEAVAAQQSGTIADLKVAAQQSLGQGFLRLATPDGRLLDPTESLLLSGLQNGDSLTAVAQQPKIAATWYAFALWCVGGDRIVTWGDPDEGGDSSSVQDRLRNVQQISSTYCAFAAILADGSVVTWGHPDNGGDCSRVQDHLRNVQQIYGTFGAFAAILADGTVVTWGDPQHGGDSSGVQDQLRNVRRICGAADAFAAILADGSVVTWGNPAWGGDSSRVNQLTDVQQVNATFAPGRFLNWCFCRHFSRWIGRDMGRSKLWWCQLHGARSVQVHLGACQCKMAARFAQCFSWAIGASTCKVLCVHGHFGLMMTLTIILKWWFWTTSHWIAVRKAVKTIESVRWRCHFR